MTWEFPEVHARINFGPRCGQGGKYDLLGRRFGRWTVIRTAPTSSRTRWLCQCDCGGEKEVLSGHLTSGKSQSCGCLRAENPTKKHGKAETAEYRIWCLMKSRCGNPRNPEYKRYGARGIRVCDRWLNDFSAFFIDMGERPSSGHSIERIDVNGIYEPRNCKWATDIEQARNMRTTRWVSYQGETISLAEAAERSGINYGTLKWRLNNGKEPFAEVMK